MKLQFYKSLIQPVILYDSETWPFRKTDENKLIAFERKMIRKIYGPVKDDITGEWRQRKNMELKVLYSGVDVLKIIRKRNIDWLVMLGEVKIRYSAQ